MSAKKSSAPKKRKRNAKRKAGGVRVRRYTAAQRERAAEVVARLEQRYPAAECALNHRNAFELVAATSLSAQCTDERVNQVTPDLFARWPTPAALARASQQEVEAVVHSTGFFRNKARNLIAMAQRVDAVYGGEIPQEMDALISLAGVARKTANVVRGVIWGLASGVVVDTHVKRISGLLGWTRRTDPVQVERDLMALHPQSAWISLSHRLIHHGRDTCIARRPQCDGCILRDLCPTAPAP